MLGMILCNVLVCGQNNCVLCTKGEIEERLLVKEWGLCQVFDEVEAQPRMASVLIFVNVRTRRL